MRLSWAGLLLFLLPTAAWGQAQGQILEIGFNNHYRPDCWTPMLVQLSNQSEQSGLFQIQVVQEDLDRDRVHYTQLETLGGTVEGKPSSTENFWVYFRPQPTDGGLPDAAMLGSSLQQLAASLKVFLTDKDGKHPVALPLTSSILSVDPANSPNSGQRSRRLVLLVSDGMDRPMFPDYSVQRGVLQDVDPVAVTPTDLPNNVIGFEAVDAIVWMDADARTLLSGTRAQTLEAIQQWVHQGGQLVICQPPEANKIKPFADMDMMPVGGLLGGEWTIPMVDSSDLSVPRRIIESADGARQSWPEKLGTFKIARVPAIPGSKVDEWMTWPEAGASPTPWLARRGVGLGSVTWVAMDLGDPALTAKTPSNWRYIWTRVFGWNDPTNVAEKYEPPTNDDPWDTGTALDAGASLMGGMDLSSRAAALISIALLFFAAYFIVAGPGVYFYLLSRKRAHLSWFYYGLSALVATGLTVILVMLVVRGPPELKHLSLVRYAAGEENAVVDSRFGLYIPQDGAETIALPGTAARQVSYIVPFGIHPEYVNNDNIVPSYEEYDVPVRDTSLSDEPAITVRYHSSSKKFQAHWIGAPPGKIEPAGAPLQLVPPGNHGYLAGSVVNHTGYDLKDIYFAFQEPQLAASDDPSAKDNTWLVYYPNWAKDTNLNLADLMANANQFIDDKNGQAPEGDKPAFGNVAAWNFIWQVQRDDFKDDMRKALPLLFIFDRVPPWPKDPAYADRKDLFHRSGRSLDFSGPINAGELAIMATAANGDDVDSTPLPIPLTVSDSPVTGGGKTIFQFVLPLDRKAVDNQPQATPLPTTLPSTAPQ